MIRKVGFTVFAAVDLVAIKIRVVQEPHCTCSLATVLGGGMDMLTKAAPRRDRTRLAWIAIPPAVSGVGRALVHKGVESRPATSGRRQCFEGRQSRMGGGNSNKVLLVC